MIPFAQNNSNLENFLLAHLVAGLKVGSNQREALSGRGALAQSSNSTRAIKSLQARSIDCLGLQILPLLTL